MSMCVPLGRVCFTTRAVSGEKGVSVLLSPDCRLCQGPPLCLLSPSLPTLPRRFPSCRSPPPRTFGGRDQTRWGGGCAGGGVTQLQLSPPLKGKV